MERVAIVLAWLAAWFVQPADFESARCAAAVHVAAASMAAGEAPGPQPKPPAPRPNVCPDCKGTGWVVHGDGHRTPCPCGIEPQGPRGDAR